MKKLLKISVRAFPLSLGLALSIVLVAKTCFELSYDSFYSGIDRIYAIESVLLRNGEQTDYSGISGAVAPGFRQFVPGVEEATRVTSVFESGRYITSDRKIIKADGSNVCADTSLFRIFDRKILAGNPAEILAMPGKVMVSESFAEKLGGVDKAVGQQIASDEAPELRFTVEGVYEDFPKNGSLDFDVIVSMASYNRWSTENWVGNDRYRGFVKLAKGVDPSSLSDAIHAMQEKNQPLDQLEKNGLKLWYRLKPLSKQHTGDKYVRSVIILLSVVTLLLLVISVLNFLLDSISSITERSRTFATYKCFGAGRKAVFLMLLKESSVTVLVSLLFSFVMLFAARGLIENIMDLSLMDMMLPVTYLVIGIVVLLLIFFTAAIPGYIYAKVPVTVALRNFSDSRRRWKHALLVSQFTINVFLFGMLAVVVSHYSRILDHNPGYETENILYTYVGGWASELQKSCCDRISAIGGVKDVIMISYLPYDLSSGNNIMLPASDKELFNVADQYYGSKGFFEFFNIPVIEGREPQNGNEVAVSRSFVEKMKNFADWSDGALGKYIFVTEHSQTLDSEDAFSICGVYEDYLIGSLNSSDGRPSIRFSGGNDAYYNYIMVKVDRMSPEIRETIARTVGDVNPVSSDAEVFSYEEQMNRLYSANRKVRDTLAAGCVIALFISVFGLVGYLRNESSRRSKEIAIRKINGAKTSDMVLMFVFDSMKMVLAAIVAGDVLIWIAASAYLDMFAEKITLGPGYFIFADIMVAAIVAVTVIIESRGISAANPADKIKND